MWLLAIEDDEGTTTFHRLSGDRCTLGRSPDNDVVLAQFNVSRHHARLEREGEGWRFIDEGSSNGSYYNGCRLLVSTPVGFDDALQVAGYRLTFREGISTNVPTPMPYYVPPARLRVLGGPGEGTEYSFRRNEVVTLGRADECSLRLLHERIIGIHARVRPLEGWRYEIIDESGHGVVVNGRRFTCKVLEGGDTIALEGVSLLRYFERGQAPDPRFDRVASESALAAAQAFGTDPLGRSGPVSGAPSALLAEGLTPPEGRIEMVGPKSLPAPAPVPISFKLAREATVLPKQRNEARARASKRQLFTIETPAYPTTLPIDAASVHADQGDSMTPTGTRRDRVITVMKRRRALEAAVAIAAMGSAAALARGVVRSTVEGAAGLRPVAGAAGDAPKLLPPSIPNEPFAPSADHASKPSPSAVAATEMRPVGVEPSARASVEPAGRGAAEPPGRGSAEPPGRAPVEPPGRGSAEPPGRGSAEPSGRAPVEPSGRVSAEPLGRASADPSAQASAGPSPLASGELSAPASSNRLRLEARLRSGHATTVEVHTLRSLCSLAGDEDCVRRADEQLTRDETKP